MALHRLGNLNGTLGRDAAAISFWEEGRANARKAGDIFVIATCTANIGITIMNDGEFERGIVLIEEALGFQRRLGVKRDVANLLFNLASAELGLGRIDIAQAYIEEGMSCARDSGDTTRIAFGSMMSGQVSQRLGDIGHAEQHYREGLLWMRSGGDPTMAIGLAEGLADVYLASGRSDRGTILIAALAHVRHSSGIPSSLVEQADIDRMMTLARQALSEARFSDAWDRGYVMTLDQAIEYALSE